MQNKKNLREKILEAVFCFIARNDPASFGVDCIEINLSVAQCMDRNLPDTMLKLQHQYGIELLREMGVISAVAALATQYPSM